MGGWLKITCKNTIRFIYFTKFKFNINQINYEVV